MTDLTEMENSLRWHFDCHAAEPGKGYKSLGIENAVNLAQAALAARDAEWREELTALADDLDHRGERARSKSPQSGRWVGRAVAYGASSTLLRALVREVTGE